MSILIVAAHPDDEVLGCGGSIAKWVKSGKEVNVLILAEGATSRDSFRNTESRIEELNSLAIASQSAGKILGVNSVQLLDFPDNRMDSIDILDIVKTVEDKIKQVKPETVVTHHSGDLNIDHKLTNQAVITACRPQPGTSVHRLLAFEIPSSTEWQNFNSANTFIPNLFEDISTTLVKKKEAMKIYNSEMRNWPHARSIKAVEHLAHWRGASVGFEAAESFIIMREIC